MVAVLKAVLSSSKASWALNVVSMVSQVHGVDEYIIDEDKNMPTS